MVTKAILIVLIGIGCVVFFVVYEKDQKMSEDTLFEEPPIEQEVETENALIYWTNRSGRIQRIRSGSSDIQNLFTDVCLSNWYSIRHFRRSDVLDERL